MHGVDTCQLQASGTSGKQMGEKKKDGTLALVFVNIFNIHSLKSILRDGEYIDVSSIMFYTFICMKYFTKNT